MLRSIRPKRATMSLPKWMWSRSPSSQLTQHSQLELFLGGIAGWDTGLRRRMDDGKPCSD